MSRLLGRRTLLALGVAALAAVPTFANPYVVFVGNQLMLYVILAVGLNILVGYAGQLAFANAAMFGIGAYGTGLLQVHFGVPYYAAAPAGALLAMLIGLAMAWPALRLSGLYLALATLAFAQFTLWVFLHWESVTFGAGGFKVPPPSFAPLPLPSNLGIYYLSLLAMAALVAIAWNVVRSRIGRAFVAIRDGEVAAQALGIDLFRYKAIAFGMSGLYAGIAGALHSALLNYVSPEGFDLFQMVLHKAMIVVGGLGSLAGSVVGATTLTLILEALREFKSTQEIAFGALLLVFVIFMPDGIVAALKQRLQGWEEPLRRVRGRPGAAAGAEARP
ncbi:MAG: branched-chain amino acid ABC transporter permease [Alphaproteobacteria bacterium]|nr:branched-chain amino acid ABC transporter permease [Alphaproteobacteria bacterium]